ncbi:hypothetical protein RHMOL_Rhmol02G0236900 [Rhododendron molle]|uniref:Uncharacterized protein n=1 Tax=Rhododendron molle TaxID=49168 RepID=A0ACC0PV75_RHOML|nr:hypothetical protein RHMOL_Rhmol02G0236900 [Rhododendron molle]
MDGVLICVEAFFPDDVNVQDEVINRELLKYKNKDGGFGRPLATMGCATNNDSYDPVYLQFNAKLINNKRRGKDVLRASEATNAQGWIVEGGDVDEEDLVLGLTWEMIEEATGADEVLQSRRTTRNVGVRGNSLIQPTPKWTESSFYRKMGCLFEKLEKVALAVQVEQKNCDAVKKRYAAAIVEQRSCYSLLKDLQEECAKNERLQSQSSTIPS